MKVNQVKLSLESIAVEDKVRLVGISPAFEYMDGAKTDKPAGFNFECLAEKNGFEKFNVRVADTTPAITAEQLAESKEPVYVAFKDFSGRFYFSERNKQWELSCKATSASIIKQTQKV